MGVDFRILIMKLQKKVNCGFGVGDESECVSKNENCCWVVFYFGGGGGGGEKCEKKTEFFWGFFFFLGGGGGRSTIVNFIIVAQSISDIVSTITAHVIVIHEL